MSGGACLARLRSESGQAVVELMGTWWLMLLAGLVAWELALVGWTAVGAANAARTTARDYSRTGDAAGARALGERSLQDAFLGGAGSSVSVSGTNEARAYVVVHVPIVVPGLDSPITIPATADMPRTG
jgi:hypothetical protein